MWRWLGAVGLVAAAITITSVIACRQLVGITDSPPEDLTSTLCGLPYGTNVCASCVQTSCCTESNACAASAACGAYQTCVGKCNGDPGCRTQCMIADPGVAPEVSALDACLASNCETQCGLTCGSIVERLTPPDASAPCQTCFHSACDTARACASSVDCDEYTRCFVACPTPDCREACATGHDAGAALFGPLQQVYANACSTACAYGQNWTCVGHVVWPATKVTSITRTGRVFDYTTGNPVRGVNLCMSGGVCFACGSPDEPYATAQTDADGGYTITLPLPATGTFGQTQTSFQGCILVSSPNIVTYWAYYGSPQTQATWNVSQADSLLTFTPSEDETNSKIIGIPFDPSRANIGMRIEDCLGTPAPGVRVSLDVSEDPAAQEFQDSGISVYYNGAVDPEDAGSTTTSQGVAIFLNVPAPDAGSGSVLLTATPVGLGKASSHTSVQVQGGVVVSTTMPPTP
ncbi:MAG: hypothetical protein ACLP1X_05250 [Polyangiaceae bacterium]